MDSVERHEGQNHPWFSARHGKSGTFTSPGICRQTFPEEKTHRRNRHSGSWLVASHVDYLLAGQRWGVTYTDISIETVEKAFHEITEDEIGPEASLFAHRAKGIQEATPEELLRAMRLYKAIRRVCKEENLDALTLSCFSLIQSLKTTGCLALSLLNDEGIPAGCEGDLQSIMTLLMVKELIGKPGLWPILRL